MEGFTIVDGVVVAIVVVSAILAYSRGIVRELMAILGWVAAAALGFAFAGAAEPLVRELPYVGGYLDNCELATIAAFALVFTIGLIVISFFTPLLSSAVRNSAAGPIDQGLGFLFGVLRGLLLVAVAFVVYDRVVVGDGIPEISDSRSALVYQRVQDDVEAQIPEDAPGWILQRYEGLVGRCIE
ncbi:CvpA family protein [Jannaschia sp. LMIT008]|uniref:CvpA family protein n=1 Tax=Jannaschia maritima TaxID=3032585 RepID=UPI0028119314|nr:CvpA family protein [Jannaschia sp. LMIT008]